MNIAGEPLPEVTWFKGKKHVKKSKRVKTDINEKTGECLLEISNATVEDSGEYTVRLVNEVSFNSLQKSKLLKNTDGNIVNSSAAALSVYSRSTGRAAIKKENEKLDCLTW
jgi:Immunoglobulin I-set domain